MSFTTEVGEIIIYLSPNEGDSNKIKVEIDEENRERFNKLKDKSSLGADCLLEGESISEVIGKNLGRDDSMSTTKLAEAEVISLHKIKSAVAPVG